jgi:hypothetical protein
MFLPDPGEVLAGLCRWLSPRGSIVAAVWSRPEDVPMIAAVVSAVRRALGLPEPPGPSPHFALADPARLEAEVRRATPALVTVEPHTVRMRWTAPDAFATWALDVSSSVGVLLRDRPGSDRGIVRDALEELGRLYRVTSGEVEMDNVALLAAGYSSSTSSSADVGSSPRRR